MCSMCVKILFDYGTERQRGCAEGECGAYCRRTCRNIYCKYLFPTAGCAEAAATCVYFDAQTVQVTPRPTYFPPYSPLHPKCTQEMCLIISQVMMGEVVGEGGGRHVLTCHGLPFLLMAPINCALQHLTSAYRLSTPQAPPH